MQNQRGAPAVSQCALGGVPHAPKGPSRPCPPLHRAGRGLCCLPTPRGVSVTAVLQHSDKQDTAQFPTAVTLSPGGHKGLSGDVFGCRDGFRQQPKGGGRDAAQHTTRPRTAPQRRAVGRDASGATVGRNPGFPGPGRPLPWLLPSQVTKGSTRDRPGGSWAILAATTCVSRVSMAPRPSDSSGFDATRPGDVASETGPSRIGSVGGPQAHQAGQPLSQGDRVGHFPVGFMRLLSRTPGPQRCPPPPTPLPGQPGLRRPEAPHPGLGCPPAGRDL